VVYSNYASVTHQMNLGALNAQGEYFMFFASDDILMKNSLNNLHKFALKNNTSVAYPGFYSVNKNKVRQKEYVPPDHSHDAIEKGCYITDVSFVKTEDFKKFLPMKFSNGKFRIYDIWKKMSLDKDMIVKRYPEPTFLYRQHGKNVHTKQKSQRNFTYVRVGSNPSLDHFYKDLKKKRISEIDENCFTICIPSPLKYLKNKDAFKNKRVIVHWDKGGTSLVDRFEDIDYIYNVTHDPEVFDILKDKNIKNVIMVKDMEDLMDYIKEERYE
jgi:hypothetical protein